MAGNIKFYYGTQTQYNALGTYDDSSIYFITDTLRIYRGSDEYTKTTQFVAALPVSGAKQGVLYVRSTDMTIWRYSGSQFQQITKSYIESIPTDGTAKDDSIPTAKAVQDYVNAKISGGTGGNFVSSVTYNKNTGELTTVTNGKTNGVVMNGLVHTPTWNSSSRTLTIPTWGQDDLVIAFGKDNVVTGGSYDADTKEIVLALSTGQEVRIPVGSLVDIYTGIATSTVNVSVSQDNKISANVIVSAKANNQIIIENDGIYVPPLDAYSKSEIDSKISAINTTLGDHTDNTTIHITDEERQTWNAKIGTQELATARSQTLATANQNAQLMANTAESNAKAYADTLNTSANNRIISIENELTWQTLQE